MLESSPLLSLLSLSQLPSIMDLEALQELSKLRAQLADTKNVKKVTKEFCRLLSVNLDGDELYVQPHQESRWAERTIAQPSSSRDVPVWPRPGRTPPLQDWKLAARDRYGGVWLDRKSVV